MSNEDLIYTQKGMTAWLTLNRPKAMNAISLSIIERMENYCRRLQRTTV